MSRRGAGRSRSGRERACRRKVIHRPLDRLAASQGRTCCAAAGGFDQGRDRRSSAEPFGEGEMAEVEVVVVEREMQSVEGARQFRGERGFARAGAARNAQHHGSAKRGRESFTTPLSPGMSRQCEQGARPFEESGEGVLDLAPSLEHLGMAEVLLAKARGEVGDAGDAQDLNAHVTRNDGFGHRGHAHQRGAQAAEGADLRGSFETRSGRGEIYAFGQIHPFRGRGLLRDMRAGAANRPQSCRRSAGPLREWRRSAAHWGR